MKKSVSNLMIAGALASLFATTTGCLKSEAERFGYKGDDLTSETNMTFLVLSPTVTNWVPERVLLVYEDYPFSDEETALLQKATALVPAVEYSEFPEGYTCQTDEPWFSLWTKPTKAFDFDGVVGILAHYDEDRSIFETSETYFSSYWPTKDEALAALAKIKSELALNFKVKKFHEFEDCWVAEYLRLGVMGVVGQKPDGTWSCMLDFRDKGHNGCGPWEPVADQQARLNQHIYKKEMIEWYSKAHALVEKNTEEIQRRAKEKNLLGFEDVVCYSNPDDSRPWFVANGSFDALAKEASVEDMMATEWTNKIENMVHALGALTMGEPTKTAHGEGPNNSTAMRWEAMTTNELYEVCLRFDFLVPGEQAPVPPDEGDTKAAPESIGRWLIFYSPVILPENALPARPVLKK